ncbi:hypothetical protein ACFE04_003711 [Oxalis oulophora]
MEEEYHNRVVQRLVLHGVPQKYLHYQGIVVFSMENNTRILGLVLSIFPTHEEMPEEEDFQECLTWLKWLMFQNEPHDSLPKFTLGQRHRCGAVWCDDDMAYTCNTCAVDLTSAMCVSGFQNGDHSGPDYEFCISLYLAGCCDCGDVTKWNPKGFFSEHKGNIQPLGDDTVANSVGPVLDALFDGILQSLISKHMLSSTGLLEFLIKSERFFVKEVVNKLHELLLDLLGQHSFTYEFAKEFIMYYPSTTKWRYFYDITTRVVEDIRFVISHVDVPQCMVRDLLRTWFRLLSFLQGVNPIKRNITTNATQDVDVPPFEVADSIGNINSRLVGGAFGISFTDDDILFEHDIDDSNDLRHRN